MRRVFDRFDRNKDGKISQEEYKAILRAMGETASTVLEDGYINFNEFMALYNNGGGVRTMDIRNAFRAFDLDNDGKISSEEVYAMLKKLGEKYSIGDCKMVSAVDLDGDGFINMNEFMSFMTCGTTPF